MLESGIGRAHNIAASTLPGYVLPGDVPPANVIGPKTSSSPRCTFTPQGTIRVPQSPGLGYHVRHELIERWTVEKEIFRA